MAVIDTVVRTVHVFAGGLLAGSVVFFTWSVVQTSSDGTLGKLAATGLAKQLTTISRFCAVLLLLSGGYMALGVPFGSDPAYDGLVGAMILLWLAITVLVEMGYSKLGGEATFADVKTYYVLAAISGLLLLIDGGILAGY